MRKISPTKKTAVLHKGPALLAMLKCITFLGLTFLLSSAHAHTNATPPSSEELTRRIESHEPKPWSKADWKRYLKQKEVEFQANHGRSSFPEQTRVDLEAGLGIYLGRVWIQAPRLKNGRYDFEGVSGRRNYVVSESGIFCKQGAVLNEYICYSPDGSYLKRVALPDIGG